VPPPPPPDPPSGVPCQPPCSPHPLAPLPPHHDEVLELLGCEADAPALPAHHRAVPLVVRLAGGGDREPRQGRGRVGRGGCHTDTARDARRHAASAIACPVRAAHRHVRAGAWPLPPPPPAHTHLSNPSDHEDPFSISSRKGVGSSNSPVHARTHTCMIFWPSQAGGQPVVLPSDGRRGLLGSQDGSLPACAQLACCVPRCCTVLRRSSTAGLGWRQVHSKASLQHASAAAIGT
jgi:hypothetical protein